MEKKVEGATGYQEKMETGDKETLEGQQLQWKRKRNDGRNVRHVYTVDREIFTVKIFSLTTFSDEN